MKGNRFCFITNILLLFVFPAFSPAAFALETIRDFHADIQVQTDGSVIVTEKITVYREGKQIRRGIYRSLPKTRGVTYSVLSVKRDGKPEPYFTEKARRFFTINTGNDTFLPHDGLYTFEITYQASNVILSFKNHDELYWNVTGNEWSFPIERASVEVVLPDGAEIRQTSSYIGFLGSKEAGLYLSEKNVFSAPRSLKQREGLTIAVGFDKGFVEATRFPLEQFAQYAALILGSYMLVTWFLFGRDPPQDVIVPRFRGPSGLTPALAGWIYSCGHNKEGCLAAALLQGGLSGFLHIKYNNGLLKVTKAREAKNGEEKTFERYMTFPLVVVDKYSPKLERFMLDFSEFLEQKAGEKYFTANTFLVFFGCVLMLALTTGLSFFAQAPYLSIIMGAYLIFSVPLGKRFLKGIVTKKFPYASFWTLFVIFLHFCATTLNVIDENPETKTVILFYVLSGFALIVYSYLIIRPTYEGMRIIAHLDGIKMFLKTVEPTLPDKVDFNSMEELLPYAFLLGLEKEWEAKIKLVAGTAYQPQWFKGHFSMNGFGNLHATLSKAGIRPIRSGLGGRGFSGGGFGGGGGGGR